MKRSKLLPLAFLAAVCLAVQLPTARAAILISGDVDPADAGDWNTNTDGYVGKTADGTLEVNGGSELASRYGYIGYSATATGEVTVDGAGSMWTNGWELYIGRDGSGTLHITGGAAVSNRYGHIGSSSGSTGVVTVDGAGSMWTTSSNLFVGLSGRGTLNITGGAEVSAGPTYVAYRTGSTGLIHFGTGGGTLTTGSLLASPIELSGTGTVNTRGLVSDIDLVFDSTASLTQNLVFDSQPDQNVTLHFDMASNPTSNGTLGAGWKGYGSLTIRDGIAVDSDRGYIGYHFGSTGVVTVDGTGSKWTNGSHPWDDLDVGYYGSGTLNITGGAAVSNSGRGFIGHFSGSTGVVTVDGSTWSSSDELYVGYYDNGTLNITGGAEVSASGSTYVAYGTDSTGLIHFGTGGGTLTTGSLLASPNQLTGTGTVDTRGLVSDVDLVFDSTASLGQTLVLDSQPEQNITVRFDMATDPNSNGALGAGWRGHGSLVIRDDITVDSDGGYIGYHSGSTGMVTVDGTGSKWTNSSELHVGRYGSGTLHITDGATVSNTNGFIGRFSGSTGAVTVDGAGSTWTNDGYFHVRGTLDVTDGAAVSNSYSHIGIDADSTSVVTVDGAGSTWTNTSRLFVGYPGSATLNITGGAAVSNTTGRIGYFYRSTSVVTVDGADSTWINSADLYIGHFGNGTLNIIGGGNVSAASVLINNLSLLAIDVSNDSLLQIDAGSGTISNDGKIRILAGAGAMAGNVYEPIAATTFSGGGGYQAVGGTWDETEHRFTASGVESGTSGSMVTIDRSHTQRLLIGDAGTGWSLGASFLAADAPSELNFTATAIGGATLTELESLLGADDSVLGGWTFAVTGGGYAEGDPAYLSFDLGPGFLRSELNLWHYDGIEWTDYAAPDLTYNDQYASFTVTDFSGYAVSAVPEPGSLALLAAAALALLALGRWKPKASVRNGTATAGPGDFAE